MPRITPTQAGGQNVCAFLDMLAVSEIGEALLAHSDDGYDVLVGSTGRAPLLFISYVDHPNIYNKQCNSTAAGRYQLLARWWFDKKDDNGNLLRRGYKSILKLSDFSPLSQDLVAIQQIRERGALPDIAVGRLAAAIAKVSNIWASLPGAGYGQHENTFEQLQAAYLAAGGALA